MIRHACDLIIAAAIILALAALFSGVRAAECFKASWYGTESGTHTATGERFTGRDMTAAMPSRKYLGRVYDVTHDGRKVRVRINDVGPAKRLNRGMDLSKSAFAKLAPTSRGLIRVCAKRVK